MLRVWLPLMLVCSVLVPGFGHAELVNAEVLPSYPTSNDLVIARILDSPTCNQHWPNQDGVTHDVTITDDVVALDLVFLDYCVQPIPGVIEYDYDLGQFPSGAYTLKIYEVSTATTFPADPEERTLLEEIEFGVAGPPAVIPTLSRVGIFCLMATLLLAALFGGRWLRARPDSRPRIESTPPS